jgi:DNA-binding GntR family transcriptional regulator
MAQGTAPTRAATVAHQLREEILTGALPPGTVIRDAALAARWNVSITPVREAIAQLSVEGLIDIAPNRTRQVTRVTQKTALELIDVMSVLACAGFEWGVHNLTPAQIHLMRQRQKEFVEALQAGNALTAGAAGADFGAIVIMASGNRELQAMIDLVVSRALRSAPMFADSLWRTVSDAHEDILRLLDAGDPHGASQRYKQMYVDYRALAQQELFHAPS